jgi:urease accessory protein
MLMLSLTQHLPPNRQVVAKFTLALTAQERTRSRRRCQLAGGQMVSWHLPRGTILRDGDLLGTATGDCLVRIVAQPEPVMTVTAERCLDLLRAAYHLGNRHVPVEIAPDYLRLSPDSVLKGMLEQLNLLVIEEIAPFEPERGAYSH